MVSTDIAEKQRFVVLDGMRGIAALAVITDHVYAGPLTDLLPGRYLAVDFFFVLSGFVLAHVYGRRLESGALSPLGFMRARLIRLFPLYLVGAAMGALFALILALKGWSDVSPMQIFSASLFALLLLPCPPSLSTGANDPFPFNGPAWSLFFELVINVVFAFVARWLTPRVCLVFMALGALGIVASAWTFGQLDGGFAWSNFIVGLPRVTFGFFTGVLLYQTRAHLKFPALPAWAAYLGLIAVFMIPGTGAWRAVIDAFAALVLFPLLVMLSANTAVSGIVMRASALIGALSYGVYVLHVPIRNWIDLVVRRIGVDPPGLVDFALVAAGAMIAAAVLTMIYDAPVRRWLSRPRVAPAAAAGD